MIHSSYYYPRVYPFNGLGLPAQIDRVQELTKTTTLNRTKIEEVGRVGIVDWRKTTPSVSLSIRQLEFGSLDFFRKLANKIDATTKIQLTDFKTSQVDICGYKTDDSGTFLGTIWYPKQKTAGFSINIGDPTALIERSFSTVGEDEIALVYNNKYFMYRAFTALGGTNEEITISDGTTYPHAVEDPDNSGQYLLRVVRVNAAGTTTTELTYTTDYTYSNSTHVMTVLTTTAGDVLKVYWSATTAGAQTFFTENDSDLAGISADSCSIYLETSNYLYRLQSVGVDISFDRYDVKEIGNLDVVARGVRDTTARVTLGRILEAYTIEEVLRGVAGISYGKLDVRKFSDNINLIIKIYSDDTKSTFKIGYKITDLSPVGIDGTAPINDYVNQGNTLEGETGFMTTVESDLTA